MTTEAKPCVEHVYWWSENADGTLRCLSRVCERCGEPRLVVRLAEHAGVPLDGGEGR